jgi:hypothetical protein
VIAGVFGVAFFALLAYVLMNGTAGNSALPTKDVEIVEIIEE